MNIADYSRHVTALVEEKLATRVRSCTYLAEGYYGKVFKVMTDQEPSLLAVKVYYRENEDQVQEVAHEANYLRFLGARCKIHYPDVYFTHVADEKCPINCICMEYLTGSRALFCPQLVFGSRQIRSRFANAVADAVLDLHNNYTNDKFGPIHHAVYDQWTDFYKPYAAEVHAKAKIMCDKKIISRRTYQVMDCAWRNFDTIFADPIPVASLVASDLQSLNIYVDKKTLEPVALLDPLCVMWADREFELYAFRYWPNIRFGTYEAYKRKYPVSEKCDLKSALYALFLEIKCDFDYGVKYPGVISLMVRDLDRQLKIWNLR